ncbi:MAG: U32 family peptidase [Thermodesulfobacteriota bacterium]|nr:U32 family peptidase [Thermodesulfobacteriota bacterium]
MKKLELLAPAGNLEKLKVAIHYGADALYLSGKVYGLRSFAQNFTISEMEEGIEYAHRKGVKVYVTVNIFSHNDDLEKLPQYLIQLEQMGIDAMIVSDPGIISMANEFIPVIPLHLSTQANCTNWRSVQFWEDQGITRINLARELSFCEIEHIKKRATAQIEIFVHGAMCMSYSGRCLLSNYLTHRDSNLGKCSQPCRWKYSLMEESRCGRYYPIFEDDRGSYILSSEDLCLIEHIPELIDAGIDAFKIEGRMKGIHYVGNVTRIYRQAINEYLNCPERYELKLDWLEELKKVSHRNYTTGFFYGSFAKPSQNYSSLSYIHTHDIVGIVREVLENTKIKVEVRNQIRIKDKVEFIGNKGKINHVFLDKINNEDNEEIRVAQPNQLILLNVGFPVSVNDIIRKMR